MCLRSETSRSRREIRPLEALRRHVGAPPGRIERRLEGDGAAVQHLFGEVAEAGNVVLGRGDGVDGGDHRHGGEIAQRVEGAADAVAVARQRTRVAGREVKEKPTRRPARQWQLEWLGGDLDLGIEADGRQGAELPLGDDAA